MTNENFDAAALAVTNYFKFNDAHHPARESADGVIKHAERLQCDRDALLRVAVGSLALVRRVMAQNEADGEAHAPELVAWENSLGAAIRGVLSEAAL